MKYFFWLAVLVLVVGAWLWIRGKEDLSPPMPVEESHTTAAVSAEAPLPALAPPPASASPAKNSPPPTPPTLVTAPRAPKEPPLLYLVDSLGVLRDAQGGVAMMGQEVATLACKDRGMRLPTIRELVTWGRQLLDKKEGTGRTMLESINALNPDGKRENFNTYYDSSGHGDSFPQEDWGGKWFRSSSRRADNPAEYFSLGVGNGYVSGGENPDPEHHNLAVRCVPEAAKPR